MLIYGSSFAMTRISVAKTLPLPICRAYTQTGRSAGIQPPKLGLPSRLMQSPSVHRSRTKCANQLWSCKPAVTRCYSQQPCKGSTGTLIIHNSEIKGFVRYRRNIKATPSNTRVGLVESEEMFRGPGWEIPARLLRETSQNSQPLRKAPRAIACPLPPQQTVDSDPSSRQPQLAPILISSCPSPCNSHHAGPSPQHRSDGFLQTSQPPNPQQTPYLQNRRKITQDEIERKKITERGSSAR
jgi:hypothetical protein